MLRRTGALAVLAAALMALAGGAAAQALRLGTAAPAIDGGPWVNGGPLTLGDLRGRVVLVEFWTFG
jgi:hypothetical protein